MIRVTSSFADRPVNFNPSGPVEDQTQKLISSTVSASAESAQFVCKIIKSLQSYQISSRDVPLSYKQPEISQLVRTVPFHFRCSTTLRDANATCAMLNFAPPGLYDSGSCLGLSSHSSTVQRFLCVESKRSSIKTDFSRREVQNYSLITDGM